MECTVLDCPVPQAVTDSAQNVPDPFRVVAAHRFVRRMRGGTQAHLIEADNGQFYVVKFSNNPQHRRVLINEAIGSVLLHHLGVSTPEPVLVSVTEEFLRENPDVSLQLPQGRTAVQPGQHYGSRYPGHPERQAVFDLVPDALLRNVENQGEFLGALVFDKWVANTDRRQAVFFRQQRDLRASTAARRIPLRAMMIDHGEILNGGFWDFSAGPLHGLHPSPHAYDAAHTLLDFDPWLEKVASFPPALIDQVRKRIPADWVHADEHRLDCLLEALVRRRGRVPDLIQDCLLAKPSAFLNCKQTRTLFPGGVSQAPSFHQIIRRSAPESDRHPVSLGSHAERRSC